MSTDDTPILDAPRAVLVEKPKANIYSALLGLSFLAIVLGTFCLYLEMKAYEFKWKADVSLPPMPVAQETVPDDQPAPDADAGQRVGEGPLVRPNNPAADPPNNAEAPPAGG